MFAVHYSYMSLGSTPGDHPPGLDSHPEFVRESLETALAAVPQAHNWEIRDSADGDRVVASYALGITVTVPRPSLLARQLLSRLSLAPSAYDSIGDIEVCSDVSVWSESSEAWVLLPESRNGGGGGTGGSRHRGTPVRGPVSFEIEQPPEIYCSPDSVTIRHPSGHMHISRRFLELRPVKSSKGPPVLWDLVILNRGLDGNPCPTTAGVYAKLDADEFLDALIIGIPVQEPRDPSALPVTWKKGLIPIGSNGNRAERWGWVRDIFGIDKRQVEMEGYGDYKYTVSRYHLTHLPSVSLIEHCKRKTSVELIADTLRREIPELASGEIGEEIGQKVKTVIEGLRDAAGWRWDR